MLNLRLISYPAARLPLPAVNVAVTEKLIRERVLEFANRRGVAAHRGQKQGIRQKPNKRLRRNGRSQGDDTIVRGNAVSLRTSDQKPDPIFPVVAGRRGLVRKAPDRQRNGIIGHRLAGENAERAAGLRERSRRTRNTRRCRTCVSDTIARRETAAHEVDVVGVTTR